MSRVRANTAEIHSDIKRKEKQLGRRIKRGKTGKHSGRNDDNVAFLRTASVGAFPNPGAII